MIAFTYKIGDSVVVAHRFRDHLSKQDMRLSIVEFLVRLDEDTNFSQKQ